jgi:hypothetical protein
LTPVDAQAAAVRGSPLERRGVFAAGVALLVGLGLLAQFRSYAGPDMAFLLEEAARVLQGARLYDELVDMNPPLIVLLNMAAVRVAWAAGISEILVYRLGCTLLLLCMLLLATWLLRRLLPGEPVPRRVVMLLLVFVLFNLAGPDFGEREHLLLALVAPYLLLAAARSLGRPIPAYPAAMIGLLAGGALAFKPHFALLWLAVEAYLRLSRRVAWRAVLPETAAIAGFLALHTMAILLWAPGYLELVGLLAGPYTRFLHVPFWQALVRGPGALLTLLAVLAFAALGRQARHPEPLAVFTLGAVAALVAAAAQQKGFGYHFYPSVALSIVVLGLIVHDRGERGRSWIASVYRVIAVSAVVTVLVLASARNVMAAIRPPRDSEQQQEKLLPVVRARAAGEAVYVFSYNISSAYPLINYAGASSASRFAQLWILASAYMEQLKGDRPLRYHEPAAMSASERFMVEAVFEDLRDRRPKLLLVLQHARDLPENGFRRLDYLGYFSRDPRIADQLARYQQVADLDDFVVYERLADGAVRSGPPPRAEPGTRDIVPVGHAGGAPLRVADPAAFLALAALVISGVLATLAERGRASRVTAGPA